ncbi:hypothetical protein D3C77_384750 [compost metagenome]
MQPVTGRQAGDLRLRHAYRRLCLVGKGQQQAANGGGFEVGGVALDDLHRVPVATVEHQQPGMGQRQPWPCFQDLAGHLLQPAQHQAQTTGIDQLVEVALQALGRLLDVVGAHQVADSRRGMFVCQVPARGCAIQRFGLPGQLARQGAAQEPAEQAVVAEPLVLSIGGLNEQVAAQQLLDQLGAVLTLGEGVAQGCTEAFENAGLQQKQAHFIALPGENVFGQVFGKLLIIAGERPDHIGQGRAPLQREGGEEQAGDPAFANCLQLRAVFVSDRQRAAATQVHLGLRRAQAQCISIDIQHLALHAQAPKAQFRVDP